MILFLSKLHRPLFFLIILTCLVNLILFSVDLKIAKQSSEIRDQLNQPKVREALTERGYGKLIYDLDKMAIYKLNQDNFFLKHLSIFRNIFIGLYAITWLASTKQDLLKMEGSLIDNAN